MKTTHKLAGLLVALAATPLVAAQAQPLANYNIVLESTFDYPGTGNSTRPQKINDNGDIVGEYVDSSGIVRGFIRYHNGTFSAPLVDPNDGGTETEGRGINNSQLVCGDYLDGSGVFHGFFYSGGNYTTYDIPGSTFTIVLGVNNNGDFCGSTVLGTQQAFVSIGGTVSEFSVPGSTATLAYQINDSDVSCGYYIDSFGVDHGFYADGSGRTRGPIDPAGSVQTIVFGNNNLNLIVGRYADASGNTHGMLFAPPNQFVIYDYPGATFTSLNGVNNRGMITGRYIDNAGVEHGILLKLTRGASDLPTLPLANSSSAPLAPLRVIDTTPAN